MAIKKSHPLYRILEILKFERKEIYAIYFYAIMLGIVQLVLPLGIQAIISFVLGGSISTSLFILIILVVLSVLLNGLLQVNQMKIIEKIQQQLFVRYSFSYAHRIPKIKLKSLRGYYLPELANRFFDVISLQKGISKLLLDIPTASIQILFGLLLLSFYHPAFIFFGIMLLFVLYLILRFTGNRGLQTSMEESNYKYRVAANLEDNARLNVLYRFIKPSYRINRIDREITNYLTARTNHFKILLIQYWTLVGFKFLITAAMLIVGALLLVNQQLNIGQFIAAEIVIILVINSVEKLIVNLDKVYDVLTSLEKINKILDKPVDEIGTIKLEESDMGPAFSAEQISFSYDDGVEVIKNVSFTIAKGEKLLIYGPKVSGKSTLLHVLSGIYNCVGGQLLINDIPQNKYDKEALLQQSMVLLDTPDIFEGTLYENLTLGQSITYEEVFRIAEIVGLKKFVDNQQDSYDMQLLSTGDGLPHSIVRKILIARMLLAKPKLALIDDAFDGMEEEIRLRVENFIKEEMKNTTMIITSGRKICNEVCDKVLVLDNGHGRLFGNIGELNNF